MEHQKKFFFLSGQAPLSHDCHIWFQDINQSKRKDDDKQKGKEEKENFAKLEDQVLQDRQEDKKKVLENQGAGRKVKKV